MEKTRVWAPKTAAAVGIISVLPAPTLSSILGQILLVLVLMTITDRTFHPSKRRSKSLELSPTALPTSSSSSLSILCSCGFHCFWERS